MILPTNDMEAGGNFLAVKTRSEKRNNYITNGMGKDTKWSWPFLGTGGACMSKESTCFPRGQRACPQESNTKQKWEPLLLSIVT